jgi:hypothetical protein
MRTPAKLALLTSLYLSQGLPFGFFGQAVTWQVPARRLVTPLIPALDGPRPAT